VIRPLDLEADAEGVLDLIHEVFPASTASVESWMHQEASIPPRAQHATWVAIEDGVVAGRAEATFKWWSDSGAAFAAVNVGGAYRKRGIGSELWERAEQHVQELGASRLTTIFVESPEGVAFARKRGFTEERAEAMSCVDPTTVDPPPEDAWCRIVPLRDADPEEVYDVDMVTTPDVPATDALTSMPFDEWLDAVWRRPNVTHDGSFVAIVDDRVVGFTILAANVERGRAFTDYTATLREHRNRGIADRLKRASLAWAAANGIRAAWTTNDETNAAMLAVNNRLGYTTRLRRVEYLRER
jgi:GNAT superfamily N-acetyltransferase